MNNTKIAVDKNFLSELRVGIMEAIASEDGLDGADGEYLLSSLGALLDTAAREDKALKALRKITSDEVAEKVKLVISHTDGSVSTVRGKIPTMYSETKLGGLTEPHPTNETLGIHTQWVEVSVTFRLDKATIEYKPRPALD